MKGLATRGFRHLDDTPQSYSGEATKAVTVKADESGLEFTTLAGALVDALVYKGVIDCSGNPNYPAADAGDTYKVSVAGKIGGTSGPNVEIGDLLLCCVDGTASGDHATVGANWDIVQVNIEGAVIGPATSVDDRIATFDGLTGKLIQDSGSVVADFAPAAKGVTNGDSHDHSGGDGAQIDHGGLAGLSDADHVVGALSFTATDKLAGRATAGAGAGEEIACTPFARTILDDADAATVRATIGAGTGNGTVTSVTGTAPIASSGGASPAISLNDGGVTYAKLQDVSATDRLLGRDTAGAGDAEELTVGGGVEFTGAAGIQTSAFTGDVTKAAGGTAQTVANDAVTYAKMQDVSATDKVLGRATAGAGDVEEIACTAFARTVLDDADAATARATLGAGTGDGTVTAVSGTAPIASSGGTTPAISLNDGGVTYAKMQDVSATDKVLGRATAGAGDVEEIACTAAGRALIDDATVADMRTTLELASAKTRSVAVYIADADTASTTVPSAIVEVPIAGTITDVTIKLGAAETCGATSVIADIHKIAAANVNTDGTGTTIYTTQGNRPTIANGGMGNVATDPDVTAVAAGDFLAFYIDQAGTDVTKVLLDVRFTVT